MSNIVGLLDLGRSALLTHQKAISVTGHNIANASTPGYSRQQVSLSANAPVNGAPGQSGTGVRAVEIERVYDRFINAQLNHEQQQLSRWQARENALNRVDLTFDEVNGAGLSQAVSDFWNAWQALSNQPDSFAEREMLLSRSEYLAAAFGNVSSNLTQQQKDIDANLSGGVSEVNRIVGEISDLNFKIVDIEAEHQNANDLRDRRDMLLQELSEWIDLNTYENEVGMLTVTTANGRPLVDGPMTWRLATADLGGGRLDIVWVDQDGNQNLVNDDLSGGQLKGWLEARDVAIAGILTRLDDMAGTLITAVNGIHSSGYDLNGLAGIDFFTGTTAGDIQVNAPIANDSNLIAASGSPAGVPGDNSNAIGMAGLQFGLLMGGGTSTIDDFYASLVSDVGSQARGAADYRQHQEAMTLSLENYRQSISGVSLDEEMLNLIKYQYAYDAAAKLVTTVDRMMETVMNMV